jgi:hypothetical protein
MFTHEKRVGFNCEQGLGHGTAQLVDIIDCFGNGDELRRHPYASQRLFGAILIDIGRSLTSGASRGCDYRQTRHFGATRT